MIDVLGHIILGFVYSTILVSAMHMPEYAFVAPWVFALVREIDQYINHDDYELKLPDRLCDILGVSVVASLYLGIMF